MQTKTKRIKKTKAMTDEERERKEGWTKEDKRPTVPDFCGQSGINIDIRDDMTSLDYFRMFVTDELTAHLVHETNIYAKQSRENIPGGEKTKSQWLEVTISEMWKLLSLLFLTGIIKKPTLSSYWSTDPLLATPFFSSFMSRDRFYSILRYFHFNNNATRPEDCTDRLYKVRPVYGMLIEKFKTVYTPGEHLPLDKGMLKWCGRLLFKVYNPQKPEKYGMKAYMLREAKSGYLCNYTLYRQRSS